MAGLVMTKTVKYESPRTMGILTGRWLQIVVQLKPQIALAPGCRVLTCDRVSGPHIDVS